MKTSVEKILVVILLSIGLLGCGPKQHLPADYPNPHPTQQVQPQTLQVQPAPPAERYQGGNADYYNAQENGGPQAGVVNHGCGGPAAFAGVNCFRQPNYSYGGYGVPYGGFGFGGVPYGGTGGFISGQGAHINNFGFSISGHH